MTELDPAAAATLAKLRDTQQQIRQLTEDADTYKEQLRAQLGAGAWTVAGEPVLSITAVRRFDPARAADVLPPEWLVAVQRTVVDAKAAKSTLPPALYEACQAESGSLTVKLT